MKDIEIKISQETRMVDLKKTVLGNDAENLQGNLIFSFTDNFVNGTARLEYEISGNKRYIMLEKNNNTYSVPIKSVLTKKGQINMQLVITEGTSENDIPIFKSNIFYVFCNQSINAEIEQPDEYPSWIEIANAKINEVDEAILGIEETKKYAVEQGNYAKEQGDYAKSQGDYAKEQKIEVVKANEEANRIINNFETNVGEYTTAFNKNANNKANDFDSNAESKTSGFNQNVDNKISEYNNNASEKLSVYNTNAENKKSEFDTNVANKTKTFNDNATNKTNAFNSNANSKTETYNNNHTEKLNAYNTNATSKVNAYNTNASTKLQEYNTNADNKIAEYDLHSQELDNKIIATRNELERVKNDVLETGTDTDTYIHLEDSAMAEYQELSVDGVCEQETRSGKNLLNLEEFKTQTTNGITATKNNDGTITLNGTSTGAIFLNLNGTKSLISITQGDIISIGVNNILPTSPTDMYVELRRYGATGNSFVIRKGQSAKVNQIANYTDNCFMFVHIPSGMTLNNFVIFPMVVKASSLGNYEPYTGGQPSPSPDYPQPISVIENSLKITSCNKNFAYLKDGTYTKENDTAIINNNLITLNTSSSTGSNSYFSFGNGYTQTWAPAGDGIKNVNDLKLTGDGGNYIATIYTNKTISGIISFRIYTSNNRELMTTISSYMTSTINISLEDGEHIKDYGIWSGSSLIFNDYQMRVQLEKGTTATPYEQHLETQIEANLPEGEFIGKINDTYKDTLKVEYNETDGQYHLNLYKRVYKNNSYNGESYNYYISTTARKDGNIECGELQTGQVVYYDGDETIIDLGIVDQLITYNEITNLFTDSDLLPTINAKYYRNFISTVRNLQVNEKALKQELIDINNRLSALETAQTNVMSESEVVE